MELTITRGAAAAILVSLLSACASVTPGAHYPKSVSHALPPAASDDLAKIVAQAAPAKPQSGFRMLSAGIDGLLMRVEVIGAARHSIDVQSYIFRGDASGLIVAAALMRAAERGVRVRLIVDDGETVSGDEKVLAMSAHQGIEVRIFNPFRYRGSSHFARGVEFVFAKHRLDYRMHNKLLIADNSVALIGGRNIGDQYFQIDPDSQFGDDDVVTAGPIVEQLSQVFDEFWNSGEAVPAPAVDRRHTSPAALDALRAAIASSKPNPGEPMSVFEERLAADEPLAGIISRATPLSLAPSEMVYDSPDKRDVESGKKSGSLIYQAVAQQASSVNVEMIMVTPYLVPSAEELDLLKSQRQRHARVRILTNSLTSAPDLAAHAGYMHYRPELLEEGVELHEIRSRLGNTRGSGQGKSITRYGNYALHGKLYVFDRKALYVGSMNFDERSSHINTEIGLIIHSDTLAQQAASRFESLTRLDNAYALELVDPPKSKGVIVWKTTEDGVLKQFTKEPARSDWQRFRVNMLSLLPIDKEL